MDRLEAMRTFVAVASLGSFVEAARRRRLSASAVTRAVVQLEDDLGVTLLNRTTRSVRMTERGEIYLDACLRILADMDDADRRVRGQDAEPRGALSLAAPLLFGRLHVQPIVLELLAAHPALSVRLTLSDRNAHLVEEGLDAAVRIGELADSRLKAARLGAVSRVLAASPTYLAKRGRPLAPADLAGHDIVAFDGLEPGGEWRFGADGPVVHVEPRLSVNSADAAIAAAEAGLGITRTLSYQVADAVAAGRLEVLLQAFAPPPLPVNVIYPSQRIASANVAAFVDAARRHFRAHPLNPAPS